MENRINPLYAPEAMLTAAVLHDPAQYVNVRWVRDDLFSYGQTREVWVGIVWIADHHPKVTDSDEFTSLVRALLIEHKRHEALMWMMKLTDAYPALSILAEHYARDLHEQHQHQDLSSAAVKMAQIANHPELALDEKVQMLEELWINTLAIAHSEPGWHPIEGLATVGEFMQGTDTTHEWVIPGMLERQERFMLIAPEKAGKSVLTRQVALLLADGHHPFDPTEPCPPMTTLMVDLENPAPVARRDFRRQVSQMEGLFSSDNERSFIWHKPAGIHLGDKNDRLLLRQVVERVEPDLLCISPIYKAYDGLDRSWEEQAFGVQKPLDQLREEHDLALWLEHHAPWGEKGMREIRAIGSSRWARWLDYQVSLVPHGPPPYQEMEWRSVRRDERKMAPSGLRRGTAGEASWVPVWADGPERGFSLAMHESEM